MSQQILLVDDSMTVRQAYGDALDQAGFQVVTAATLAEARAALAEHDPDLLVLDVHLPDGDGLDLLAELRVEEDRQGRWARPVMILSSDRQLDQRLRSVQAGAEDVADKSGAGEAFLHRVHELLERGAARRARQGQPRGQVLIVDDSPIFHREAAAELEAAGFTVLGAPDLETGLRITDRLRPDVLVVDGLLPDGVGADLVQRVRLDPALRETPVLIATASLDAEDEVRALHAGADGYLRKSSDLGELVARVEALLRARTTTPGSASQEGLYGRHRVLLAGSSRDLPLLRQWLEGEGLDVDQVATGEQALARASSTAYHCLLIDGGLEQPSARELCQMLRADLAARHVPTLVRGATADEAALEALLQAGADDVLPAGLSMRVVLARLTAQMRRQSSAREARRVRDELYRRELEFSRERTARQHAEERAALLAKLQDTVAELERSNQELQRFAAVISHDLKEPLRTTANFSGLLARRYRDQLDEKGQRYLARIQEGADRMGRMIDAMLDYASLGHAPAARGPLDLARVFVEVVTDLEARIRQTRAQVQVGEVLPVVSGDRVLLHRLFLNLLGNALKFHRPDQPPRVEVSAHERGREVVVSVRDHGIGMDPAHVERAFELFQRVAGSEQRDGAGVGLSAVRRIAELHGGSVTIDTAPGEGTTVHVHLLRGRVPDSRPPAGREPLA